MKKKINSKDLLIINGLGPSGPPSKRKVEATNSQDGDMTAKREKKRKVRNWVKILNNFDISQGRVAIEEKTAYLKREVSY